MALYLRYAVRSDLGLVRNNNEDSVYAGPRLLAIADGMGGHAAGEVASKIVIGTMEPLDEDRRIDDLMASLRDTVLAANHGIASAVEHDQQLEGMGTTLTALRFVGGQVGLVHVGDSRAYLLRNNVLTQITHDDTYVQYLVDNGKLTPDEAKDHPRKSVILRALLGTDVEPDVSIREARHGDRYLLCSDGLSDVVSTETILETLRIEDVQDSADRLVELALRGGGPDNVTVIVADVINARVGDVIDDVPVIAGAFVDPAAADVPGVTNESSAAERAAQMARATAAPAAAPPVEKRRRFRWKPWLIGLAIAVVIVGGLGLTYAWTQTQYYVGEDGRGGEVTIFRGVNAAFGPLKFSTVYKNTNLEIDDLTPSVRSTVKSGITAEDARAAERVVTNLRSNLLPVCRTAPSLSTTTPTAPTTAPATAPAGRPTTARTLPGTTARSAPARSTPARSTPAATRPTTMLPTTMLPTTMLPTTTPPTTPPPTTPVSTPVSTPRQRPGVNCR